MSSHFAFELRTPYLEEEFQGRLDRIDLTLLANHHIYL
jgi:hypothetical protein